MIGLNSHVVFGETHNEVVKYDLYILNPRHPINVKSFIKLRYKIPASEL